MKQIVAFRNFADEPMKTIFYPLGKENLQIFWDSRHIVGSIVNYI